MRSRPRLATTWPLPSRRSGTLVGAAVGLGLLASGCSSAGEVETVDPAEAVALIERGAHVVVDVRTPAEFAAGHVEGAVNVDVTSPAFTSALEELDRDEEYVLYCQSGNRSARAAEKMAALGFSVVVDAGGVGALESAGADIVGQG